MADIPKLYFVILDEASWELLKGQIAHWDFVSARPATGLDVTQIYGITQVSLKNEFLERQYAFAGYVKAACSGRYLTYQNFVLDQVLARALQLSLEQEKRR